MELRRRNLIRPDELPYDTGVPTQRGTIVYGDGDFPAGFARLLDAVDYDAFRTRQAAERGHGVYLGIGVANAIEMAGTVVGEGARVRIETDGEVTVAVGVANLGQGLPTAFAQIAAARLGVQMERVRVVTGDTAAIADGIGTFASRSTIAAGNAVGAAAGRLRQRILAAAAERLEAPAADLDWTGERIAVRGAPRRSVLLADIVHAAGDVALEEEASTPGPRTFGYQGHAVVVAVDPGTLEVHIEDYVICHDAGTVVNPLLANGQTIGSAVQGLGIALSEEMRFDAAGRPLTTSLHTYLLPTSSDTPDYRLIEQHFPPDSNPEGFKGLAEGGAIPSMPAIAQAIEDALAPFGVRFDSVPITPQRIHDALARHTTGGTP